MWTLINSPKWRENCTGKKIMARYLSCYYSTLTIFLALLCLPDGFNYKRNHLGVARTSNQSQACKVFNWSKLDLHVVHILPNVTTYSITTTAFPKTSPRREKFKWFVSFLLISGGLLVLETLQTFIQCLSVCCCWDVILFACSAGSNPDGASR